MSAVLKCILGLCVVLCFVQFIEMARVPREEPSKDPAADLLKNLQNLVGDVVDKVKTAAESEQVKKLFDDAAKVLADTAKAAQEKIHEMSKNVDDKQV